MIYKMVLISTIIFFAASCEIIVVGHSHLPAVITPAIRIDFSSLSPDQTVTLDNLRGQDVYFVKSNVSVASVPASQTGSASVLPSASARNAVSDLGAVSGEYNGVVRLDHPGAWAFNNNPPPFTAPVSDKTDRSAAGIASSFLYSVPATKQFWVPDASQNWKQINATLRAVGSRCYIWFADNDTVTLTTQQAGNMAAKFDIIYPLATNVLGFEYGGGPAASLGNAPEGGIDGDPKISILVYDIDYDYSAGQNSGVFGYFYSKDLFQDQSYSNLAEMFYLDSYFTKQFPDEMYCTLVHEFQHMINFNRKFIKNSVNSDPWYNEMLSQVAEDMLASLIGIDISASPSQFRIPQFNAGYDTSGVTQWNNDLASYANVYAFGAYLVRNYGGAALVKAMLDNSSAGIVSVSGALQALYPATFPSGTNAFESAFRRYGEALVYSGSSVTGGANSFDKTVTTTINETTYTFPAFDIWTMPNKQLAGSGPSVWKLQNQNDLAPYSVTLQSASEWQNVWGSLTLTVNMPLDPSVELYLMVR